ncbi:hypothetical protein VF21_07745 [Pseudogymnoascus sp. 05NY08]|nr:hypothetical protein VF21_07745 [Pseudogymnoascus sp. 05NY08]
MADQEPDAATPTSAPAKRKACETQETVKPKRVRRPERVVERAQSSDKEDEDDSSNTSHDLQQQVDALTTRICAIEDELEEHREIKSQRKIVNTTQNNVVKVIDMLERMKVDQRDASRKHHALFKEARDHFQELRNELDAFFQEVLGGQRAFVHRVLARMPPWLAFRLRRRRL